MWIKFPLAREDPLAIILSVNQRFLLFPKQSQILILSKEVDI